MRGFDLLKLTKGFGRRELAYRLYRSADGENKENDYCWRNQSSRNGKSGEERRKEGCKGVMFGIRLTVMKERVKSMRV